MKNGKNGINLNVSRQLKFLYIIRSSPCRMSRGGSVGLVEKNISSLVECSQFSLRIQVLALCAVSEYNNRKSTGRYE